MADPDPLSVLVERVVNGDIETDDIETLALLASENGLSPTHIAKLLATVMGSTLSSPQLLRVLRDCMVPRPQSQLTQDIYLRVIGCVGAPELYYKNGKQHKLKRLPLPFQQKLLQWLICILPHFGEQVFTYTRRSLPLLMGLLSYEFLRPYIVTLVVVGTCKQSTLQTRLKVLRSWHTQIVADLYLRFPQDESLVSLLYHFSKTDPQLDLKKYLKNQTPTFLSVLSLIGFQDIPVLRNARNLRRTSKSHLSAAISDVDADLCRLFNSFGHSSKKRKVDFSNLQDLLPSFDPNAIPISAINSVQALAKNFENIKLINPSSVLNPGLSRNSRIRCMYVALRLLGSDSEDLFYKKLLFAMRHHVLGTKALPTYAFEQLLRFAQFGGLLRYGGLVLEFLLTSSAAKAILRQRIELLRYAKEIAGLELVFEGIAKETLLLFTRRDISANAMALSLLRNASLCVKKYDNPSFVKTATTAIFDIVSKAWPHLNLLVKLGFMAYLRVIRLLASQEQEDGSFFIPPIALFYLLVCSTYPLIVSEALGYARFLKALKFPEGSFSHMVRNVFIIDCANFIWRDRAFQDEGANSGMFLDQEYLQKLGSLNYFSISDLVLLNSLGNLIQNPAFSYICAELVWKLEDSLPDITCRHPGPLSESTIEHFQRDPGVVWLPMTYADIRLKLLRSLDEMGFSGLGDFLFTSIRSLTDKREA